ncbi:MAG: hypothetical protein J2P18_16725 [Nocardia sp.]|nr:hypothetical protein [Nocardia sp.]
MSGDCFKACDDQLQVYHECQNLLQHMTHVTGLGDFPASDELAKMLGAKAIGGEGDFDSALKAHIEVRQQIRETIKHSVNRLTSQDQQNAQRVAGTAGD